MNIVLLCGGSGKRLWPLSNDVRSKQFIEVFPRQDGTYESMLQRICRQIKETDPNARILCATGKTQVSAIRNQVGDEVLVSAEPERRDTFPAIALAAAYLSEVREIDPEEPLIICPVDSYVGSGYYAAMKQMEQGIREGKANIILMAAKPQEPSTQYGYILCGAGENTDCSPVSGFYEKPTEAEAAALIEKGAFWNCGVAALKLGYLLEAAHRITPFEDYQDLLSRYGSLKPVSFEKAVVEREKRIGAVRFSDPWKKLDTWENLVDEMAEPNVGNVHLDRNCRGNHVINELDLPILCLGLENMIVSASPEGILVTEKSRSGELKAMVDALQGRQIMMADKSWGTFQVLDVQNESMTIRATLRAGQRMSYHSHERRDEVWTIVSGSGRTVVDGMEQPVQAGDVITMQAGCRHTIIADTELKIIEVQLGREISVHDKRKYELED